MSLRFLQSVFFQSAIRTFSGKGLLFKKGMLAFCLVGCFTFVPVSVQAQELNCKVTIDHSSIQGTNVDIFQSLEAAIKAFMNERQWTNDQYAISERIDCALSFTLKQYSATDGTFSGELIVQSSRPIFGSSYTSTMLNYKDNNISFNYQSYDQLQFRIDNIDSNLTALLAYYAYLIIGFDMDSYAPMGGTWALDRCEAIVNAAQSFSEPGWKAYEDSKNRHGVITDYVLESLKPVRQMMYDYHRLGLDAMASNVGLGRAKVTSAMEELHQAYKVKATSYVPQLITEAKRDELVNVYSKAPTSEKEAVYEIVSDINPSLNTTWQKIKAKN